jgi:glycosyltransferase involved in cell wall biosynthesis
MCPGEPLLIGARPVYHVITPGDHYSPETGSAIPTVVHGLAHAGEQARSFPQHVVVQRGTYANRYRSAQILEYRGGPPPTRRERLVDAALGMVGLTRPFATRAYLPVAEALRSAPPGIVVAHNGAALARLMRHSKHRFVLYAHNDLFRSYSSMEATRVVKACDRVICVSRFLRDEMAGRVSRSRRDRFRVVANGVDTRQFSPDGSRARDERRQDAMRVVFVGRVVPDKGPDVLIRAARLLARDDVEFTIIGSQGFDRGAQLSPYEHELRQLAGHDRRIGFEPFIDRETLPKVLRDCDVLVVPSRWPEPWALTVGEGMASGLAVIASAIGGIPEQVGDAGILIPPDDPAALAAAIATLADDLTVRHALSAAARQRALDRDWSSSWLQFEGVLSELAVPA